jgi:hypothetical protein
MAQRIRAKQVAGDIIIAAGSNPFTAAQSMGGNKLTNVATPTAGTDAVNKDYVDNAVAGLSWKDSVRAASTANIDLATGGPLTIDGVSVIANDRVLVKDQTLPQQNGIYQVNAGAWTRVLDCDTALELEGAAVFVEEGTANGNKMFTQTAENFTLGTDPVTWVLFSAATSLTAGAGLLETGSTWSVELATDPGLEFDAGGDGGRLRAKVNSTGGLERVAGGLGILLNGDSMALSGAGVKAGQPSAANKYQTPTATAGDEQTTGLTIVNTPAGDSHVDVKVNGISYDVGDGVKTKDCYFSSDGGTTAKTIATIAAGDTLYWNGTISGFNLDTVDRVSMHYNAT